MLAANGEYLPDVRNSTRVMVDDDVSAHALFHRIQRFLPPTWHRSSRLTPGEAVWQLEGLNERLRFLRYEPGEKFEPHLDGSFVRTDGDKAGDRSFVTVLLYLNTGTGACARERAAGVPRGGPTFTTASQGTRQRFVICTHTQHSITCTH